jgi:hypothetical protein
VDGEGLPRKRVADLVVDREAVAGSVDGLKEPVRRLAGGGEEQDPRWVSAFGIRRVQISVAQAATPIRSALNETMISSDISLPGPVGTTGRLSQFPNSCRRR